MICLPSEKSTSICLSCEKDNYGCRLVGYPLPAAHISEIILRYLDSRGATALCSRDHARGGPGHPDRRQGSVAEFGEQPGSCAQGLPTCYGRVQKGDRSRKKSGDSCPQPFRLEDHRPHAGGEVPSSAKIGPVAVYGRKSNRPTPRIYN